MSRGLASVVGLSAIMLGGLSQAHAAEGIVLASSSASSGGTTSLTFAHTIGGGSNRYLVLAIGLNRFMSVSVGSVTYNGIALSEIGTQTQGGGCTSTIWHLAHASLPAAGTYNVVINVGGAGANRIFGTALSFTGVDQNNLPGSKAANSSSADTNPTVNITTSRAQFVVDTACLRSTGTMTNATLDAVGANQTVVSNQANSVVAVGVSTEPGANVALPSTGTTTMSWTGSITGDLNGWSSNAIVLKPSNTTAIRLADFSARPLERGARLSWRTGFEIDHLGFHVYREDGSGRTRITTSPILGSGWLAGPGLALAAGRSYAVDDLWTGGGRSPRYWLEEIEMGGQRRLHGPIVASGPRPPAGPDTAKVQAQAETPSAPADSPPPPWAQAPFLAAGEESPLQWGLAAGAAVKLGVDREGWYEVSQPALVAAGLDPGTDPRNLALFVDGRELPILVSGEEDGRFGPTDLVGFYGRGLNAPGTDRRVYWLAARDRPGRRVERPGAPAAGRTGPAWFPWTVERHPRQTYFAALKNGDGNRFFGPMAGSTPVGTTLPIQDLVRGAAELPVLEVGLQGASFTPHAVTITLDGVVQSVARFEGRRHETVRVPLTAQLPANGEIEVAVSTAGGDADAVLLDFVRLTHARAFLARDGWLRASAAGGAALRLGGFGPGERIAVQDVTEEDRVLALADGYADGAGAFDLTVPGTGQRQLIARAVAVASAPAVGGNRPSRWNVPQAGADLVAIGPASLLAEIGPLVRLRQREGWSAALVDIDDVYDEFSFGAKQTDALRSFVARAARAWARPPRAILLLGDASFDPRNLLGKGAFDVVPTKLVDTAYLETASDDWFTDWNGDGIADVPVGRLPARTPADLAVMIAKVVAAPVFDSHPATALGGPLVFVSGRDDDTTSFSMASAQLRAAVPAAVRTVALQPGPSEPDAAGRLRRLLSDGAPFVGYTGHGSETLWAGGLLSNESIAELPEVGPGAFWIALTCLNGFFHDVHQTSLSETLLARRQGGAFGVWASSGLTDLSGQAVMGRAFVEQLVGRGLTVGEAAALAKAAIADRDVRTTWVLLGDPTWRMIRSQAAGTGRLPAPAGSGMAPDAGGDPLSDGGIAPARSLAAGCDCAMDAAPRENRAGWRAGALVAMLVVTLARRRRS